ncbi:MAG: hypothetical protein LBG08_08015 [Spirochaetaceae bacterium]|nr:hypothetical protein [Spirochaetaceae bacterium]
MTGCTDVMGEDWIEARNIPEADDSKIISNYDLQSYVPVPVEGQEALLFLIQGNLEVRVAWRNEGGEITGSFAFIGGKTYQADITLKTKNGYTFDPEKSFKYYTASVGDQPEDNFHTASRELSVTYLSVPATEQNRKKLISNYDLQYYVPVPTTRGTPVQHLARGDMYVDVVWMKKGEDTELPESFDSFKDNTAYQAKITLSVNNDYFFDLDMSFYYLEGEVEAQEAIIESDESPEVIRKLLITYNPTEKLTILGKNEVNEPEPISLNGIERPVTGGEPILAVSDGRYTGVVLWDPSDETFEANTSYTATVMLYTASGYQFAADCTAEHSATEDVITSASDGTVMLVRIAFPSTGSGE